MLPAALGPLAAEAAIRYRPCPTHQGAGLDDLLEKVERGEDVLVTRDGPPFEGPPATVSAREPFRSLAALRASMPPWRKSSTELIREMRDESP